jgi:3-methyladenine DNA glycosylase/8-oxoguanine DNA glycosylase
MQAVSVSKRVRTPYDGARLLRYLRGRAIPGVEEVDDSTYRRMVSTPEGPAVLQLRQSGSDRVLIAIVGADMNDSIFAGAGRLLDVDADPALIGAALGADPALAPLVAARPGLRLPGAYDGFELAVRALLGQQVTVRGASTLAGRVVDRAGMRVAAPDGRLTHLFPTPDALAAADLAGIGMPGRRIAALQGLARAVADGDVRLDDDADRDATRAALLALPGIGPWTVDYLAMRALGDRDAFPAGDLGLRRAAAALGLPTEERALRAYAERWRPWRAYAAMHLWTWAVEDGPEQRDR